MAYTETIMKRVNEDDYAVEKFSIKNGITTYKLIQKTGPDSPEKEIVFNDVNDVKIIIRLLQVIYP